MFSYRPSQVKPGLVVAAILLISSPICRQATANGAEAQVCDVSADYSLGVEDYADAIRIHREILRKNPDNALAHYHLGFAEGMSKIERQRSLKIGAPKCLDLELGTYS
jgi:hypothetical protein